MLMPQKKDFAKAYKYQGLYVSLPRQHGERRG